MPTPIPHTNKDILFKALSQLYQNKSLAVYGLNIPRIKRLLPTNYPTVTANEYRGDGAFLLEGDILYLQEYESTVARADFFKYNRYILLAMEQLRAEGIEPTEVILGVIYTGDVTSAPNELDLGALRIQVQQVFLSNVDTDATLADIKAKAEAGLVLSDEDMLRLVILPLTQPDDAQKQVLVEDAIKLAKILSDERQQALAISGVLVASDKFIDQNYRNQILEWLKMSKVAQWYEEEKIEAVNTAVAETRKESMLQVARAMLADGENYLKVMKFTGLSRAEIAKVEESLFIPA